MYLDLRIAVNRDVELITGIHNQWAPVGSLESISQGFLLQTTSAEKISSSVENPTMKVFVAEAAGKVVGYLVASPSIEQLDFLKWEPRTDSTLLCNNHWHVNELAVDSASLGRGVGKALYEFFLISVGSTTVSAFIAVAPFFNATSMMFHQKQGFKKAASFHSPSFCGLENYASELWIRFRPIPGKLFHSYELPFRIVEFKGVIRWFLPEYPAGVSNRVDALA